MQDILSSVYCFRSEQTSVLGLITFGPNWKFHKSDYYYYSSIYVVAIFIISTFSLLINSWNGDFQHFQLWKKEKISFLYFNCLKEKDIYTSKQVHTRKMYIIHTCIHVRQMRMCMCVKTSSVTHFQFDKHDFIFLICCIHITHITHSSYGWMCWQQWQQQHQSGNNIIMTTTTKLKRKCLSKSK